VASILLGVADVLGKYYVPSLGGLIIYIVLVAVLVVRPNGLFSRAN
jgi:branched-chain amino acid transport system permease protein